MPVNTPRSEYAAMLEKWQRCEDCYDGSDAVKTRGEAYLPKLQSHIQQPEKYDSYKMRALFYNAFGRTVDGLAGTIFQKSPKIEMPPGCEEDMKDVTMSGLSAELFGLRTTRGVIKSGRAGILIDMDASPSTNGRPYWVGYDARQIINWRTTRINGDDMVVRVILAEEVEEDDPKDLFKLVCRKQCRVLTLEDPAGARRYSQTLWRLDVEHGTWVMGETIYPARKGTSLDFIPFVFVGPTSTAPDIEKPPLLDLADVNLSHYRTMADLEHGRHFTALPTPWVAGLADQSLNQLALGATVIAVETNGKVGMLEFTGAGLSALVQADTDKRKLMATLGARLLEDASTSAETATAVSMRHAGEHATLRTIAQSVEQALTMACRWHAWWAGIDATPEDVECEYELNHDFFSLRATPDEVKTLFLLRQAGEISYETFYAGLKVGGWTRLDVDAEAEREAIAREATDGLGGPGGGTSDTGDAGDGGDSGDQGGDTGGDQTGGPPPVASQGTMGAKPMAKVPVVAHARTMPIA